MGVLHSSGYIWWIERGKLAIGLTSDNGVTVNPPSDAGKTIRMYCKEVAQVDNGSGTALSEFSTGSSINLNEFSLLPSQFHEALIAKVMEKLYRRQPEGVQMAEYWRSVYDKFVLEGKKYANQNKNDSGFTVAQYYM